MSWVKKEKKSHNPQPQHNIHSHNTDMPQFSQFPKNNPPITFGFYLLYMMLN